MSDTELSEATTRQRRNLIAVCTMIILIEYADVNFGGSISYLGASFTVGNPGFIHTMLYLATAYFAWRCYQYFASDRAHHHILTEYRNYLDNTTRKRLLS
jgi:hypothetical protein